MKIQELAIIFIIIILPISLVISEYTQFQIQTISLQTEYDTKLTVATYDAIKAFQLNTQNESYSDMTNQKLSDLTASINAFRNSLRASFKLNGYTEEELDNYIPALVYTLYDGFYIYSPYENIVDSNGEILEDKSQRESLYGIKPYINYSCRYIASGIDVIITYALDNYISVRGQINGEYVNKSGYLIDEITVEESTGKVTYNNQIQITTEQLREYLPIPKAETGTIPESYPYIKINGTKYYKVDLKLDVEGDDSIIALKNGVYSLQCQKKNIPEGEELDQGTKDYESYSAFIDNNNQAIQYYKAAAQFTKWVRDKLENLKYKDAVNEDGDSIWEGNTTPIFKKDELNKIENDLSNFNQHRLAIIRNKIETNLAIAISNYNNYSRAATNNVFLMPELKENEWDYIIHNISLISFMQGLPIGGKIYNGYSIVTNSESEEVVLEENIYILGSDRNYHKIGDKGFANKEKEINAGNYGNSNSAGRINQDFNRAYIINDDDTSYYYPLQQYNASYDSIVMQNNITTYEDLYKYVDSQTQNNPDLVKAFYTALGRERVSKYNSNFVLDVDFLQGEKYIIEYKANADNVTNLPTTQVKIEGIDTNIAPEIPERGDQYRFKGWSTSQTALEVEYESGDTYTDDAPLTLYAVWELKKYTVSYDANGGSGAPNSLQKEHGTNLTISSQIPTRTGYNFKGWSTTSNATTAQYQPGSIYPQTGGVTNNATLYAVWESKIKAAKIGGYVEYTANGYSSWRIMYNNNGQLDIVSTGSVGLKTLYGEADYKNAAGILNEFCRQYINSTYANTARSLGYASTTEEYVTKTFDYNSKREPFEDKGYVNDVNQLINNNMVQTDTSVWLASRAIKGWTSNIFTGNFGTEGRVRYLNTNGSDDSTFLHDSAFNHSHDENYYRTHGVRPVVSLKSGLKIVGGDGTQANPYKLSN